MVNEVTEEAELPARISTPLNPDQARTEPAETERQLRAQVELERNRLHDVLAQAPAPMALLSGPEHIFVFVNAAYVKVTGRDRDQLLGKTAREVFPEFAEQGFFELLDRVYVTGESYLASGRKVIIHRCGGEQSLYFDFTYFPMRDLAGAVHGILLHGVDVTQPVLAQAQLEARVKERTAELEDARDNLRILNHNLMRVQEEERRRLALELHDGAGQLLAALRWKLHPLQQMIGEERPELGKFAKDSLQLLEELSQELRTVSHLLHPPVLDDRSLPSALRAYIDGLRERSGLMVELEIDSSLEKLSEDLKAMLFRIVQESLTNVHRHAKTRIARVQITCGPQKVMIQVQDKGQGIPGFTSLDDPNVKMGLGIQGMRERVRQLKGQFNIESGVSGTTLTAALPINGRLKSQTGGV
jgi:PAS domain S-box-containing protein